MNRSFNLLFYVKRSKMNADDLAPFTYVSQLTVCASERERFSERLITYHTKK
jgi:hypothetical protein